MSIDTTTAKYMSDSQLIMLALAEVMVRLNCSSKISEELGKRATEIRANMNLNEYIEYRKARGDSMDEILYCSKKEGQ